jgi:hypothetical protein
LTVVFQNRNRRVTPQRLEDRRDEIENWELKTGNCKMPKAKPAKRSRHIQRYDGEGWEVKSKVPFQITCCDCGLVHTLVIVAGREGAVIGIAAKRDNRCTGQRRRQLRKAGKMMRGKMMRTGN